MLGINSNINSLVAQQNLTSSGSALSQAITRLSSGKRINSAADDAAGLAISNIMQTQINGLNQGVSNANNGVSMVQTASSGLSSLTSSLQTIRQLATQASDGSMTDTDRQALQQEVAQQIQEVNRIASQTTYNGMNVLNGSLGNVSFQVGANVGQSISLNLTQNMSAAQIGTGNVQAGNTLGSFTGLSLNANGTAFAGASAAPTTTVTATADAAGDVTYKDQNGTVLETDSAASIAANTPSTNAVVLQAQAVYKAASGGTSMATNAVAAQTLNGSSVSQTGLSLNSNGSTAEITSLTNTGTTAAPVYTDQNGNTVNTGTTAGAAIVAAAMAANGGALTGGTKVSNLTLDASSGGQYSATQTTTAALTSINVQSDGNGGFTFTDQNNVALSSSAMAQIFGNATATTNSSGVTSYTFAHGGATIAADINTATGESTSNPATAAAATANLNVGSSIDALNNVGSVSNINISTQAGASAAMESIDNALNTVNNLQATLGAAQNRFTAITTTQQAQSTDLSSAQSSIQDADFAQETANLSKAQVLQQAGISVLAQANSQPQQILKLLQ
ncbi:flagellin [Paraburkholderia pallida]|uniref:Flagellin n=1 Tax=Paraburkholderia pallida TaxID=2547399 RepID=A0A4P7CQQ8_9BURK|nr:flagellin [Paraburkholderia pallida]QBQ96309.1 flagellin [Paraburkholderia pallida]